MRAYLTASLILGLALTCSQSASVAAAPPDAQAAGAKPGSLALTVVNESGSHVAGASVTVHGAVDRKAQTSADGVATVLNLPAGVYRCRITRDGYITLEKEVTVRAGVRASSEAVVSAATAPAPTPTPTPTPTPAVEKQRPQSQLSGPVGQPRALSLADLAESMLREKEPIVERDLGCSVATSAKLILVRETLASHAHADADEMYYVVAGDATLRIFDKDHSISPGWFGLVPRGTSHSLSRRGRNAPIVLSVQSGPPCGG